MHPQNQMVIDFKLPGEPGTRAEFTYLMARQGQGAWHGVRWDGKTATSFPLNETDETKAMRALLLQHFA
jgi:hypothetical protein